MWHTPVDKTGVFCYYRYINGLRNVKLLHPMIHHQPRPMGCINTSLISTMEGIVEIIPSVFPALIPNPFSNDYFNSKKQSDNHLGGFLRVGNFYQQPPLCRLVRRSDDSNSVGSNYLLHRRLHRCSPRGHRWHP